MGGLSSTVRSLEELRDALHVAIGSPTVFSCLNTRLIIQLGVNLKDIDPEQNEDVALLRRVTDALGRMNIRLGTQVA